MEGREVLAGSLPRGDSINTEQIYLISREMRNHVFLVMVPIVLLSRLFLLDLLPPQNVNKCITSHNPENC